MIKKPEISLYKCTPDHYDAMMTTALETSIFQAVTNEIKNHLGFGKTLILDLCCGTGLLPQMLIGIKNIKYIGVDINKKFLESAQKKTKNHDNFEYILQNAIKYEADLKFDIVILTSAYHHVENKLKIPLLQKIHKLLKKNGILIIYEKAIGPYKNEEEFKRSNKEFYLKRIEYLKETENKRLSKKQYNALMNICALSASAEEEYKVDYNYIINNFNKAGFSIIKEIKIWPKENLFQNDKIGDFIFITKK